jgi:hypothetical protein
MSVGVRTHSLSESNTTLAHEPESRSAVGVAQLHAAGRGDCQCFLRAPRDGLSLSWGDEGHDADGEGVGLRRVAGEENTGSLPEWLGRVPQDYTFYC